MQTESTFQVYNASAGSGKTFTLVKEYLKILLSHEDMFTFQRILAITFTNKAAAEMKDRVLKSLQSFSEEKEHALREILLQETGLDASVLKTRSEKLLNAILQNYSAFYITTIDSFTYKIVKSFAYDLGLSQNFEVEMDAQDLLNQAVDLLISRIGNDKQLTDVLIEYSLEKTEDDKSWDIAHDLMEFSKILLNEDDARYFQKLSDTSIADFLALKNKTQKVKERIENDFKIIGVKALDLISASNLEFKDFAYAGECPKHFEKLVNLKNLKPDDLKFEGRLNSYFEEGKSLHASKVSIDVQTSIEGIYEALKEFYLASKQLYEGCYQEYLLSQLLLKSIIPLTVLNNINQELNEIKEDNNIRLNIEFNQLISEHIQEQPAPFIYERIGQKFMHYFIDEMQDTSVLQWTNLIPLIDNSLSQENTSLLLVGDGKQAIYRWRGGKAEQFIGLGSEDAQSENPFFVAKQIKELKTNFRSFSEIVQFNNSLFQYVSRFIQNEAYKQLFTAHSYQLENSNKGGFVSLSFLEKEVEKSDEHLKYAKKVNAILQNLDKGFRFSDVCVLVRKKKEGVVIANYLSSQGVEIVSSETLLLSNSRKVHFLINFLKYTLFSHDKESHFEMLAFLHDFLQLTQDKHSFLESHIHLNVQDFFKAMQSFGIDFHWMEYHQLPLYEKVEQVVRSFDLLKEPDAYVQFFLDEVLHQQKKEASLQELLDFWELKKDQLSVVSSENENAVQIMTIHKSKGLEFPVVIFPCDLEIYRELKPKTWLKVDDDFPHLMVNLNKDLQKVSAEGELLYQQRQEALELDNFNLLYVALTRASEQLYIITDKNLNRSGNENTRFYSGVFISYLKEKGLWQEGQNEYAFGASCKMSSETKTLVSSENQTHFISTPWKDHNINLLASSSKLWGTVRGEAIDYGDLIHEMMAQIITLSDVKPTLELYQSKGELDHVNSDKITHLIYSLVQHHRLENYYLGGFQVYNEREIVDKKGQTIIIDRLLLDENKKAVIIDYKTGLATKAHIHQLEHYASVIENLGYVVDKKILVYINETISIEEF